MIFNLMWVIAISGIMLLGVSIWLNWYIGQPSKRVRTPYKSSLEAPDYYKEGMKLNTDIIYILMANRELK